MCGFGTYLILKVVSLTDGLSIKRKGIVYVLWCGNTLLSGTVAFYYFPQLTPSICPKAERMNCVCVCACVCLCVNKSCIHMWLSLCVAGDLCMHPSSLQWSGKSPFTPLVCFVWKASFPTPSRCSYIDRLPKTTVWFPPANYFLGKQSPQHSSSLVHSWSAGFHSRKGGEKLLQEVVMFVHKRVCLFN